LQKSVLPCFLFAKASKYRDKLPDRPQPKPDDPNAQSNQPTPPCKNKLLSSLRRPAGKKGAHKIRWAELLKRTFAIDVLQCSQCKLGKSRMRLVAVVCDSPTIQTTLTAMGISPHQPPIAPPKRTRLWGEGKTLDAWDRNGFDVSESDNTSNSHSLIDGDFYPD
jgi:hypothetical protein